MKKRIKSIALSTLFILPMLLSGCKSPFDTQNSIGTGEDYNETGPTAPTPSAGGSSSSTPDTPEEETKEEFLLYNPYNYEEGENPYEELSKHIGYVKSVYKKGTDVVTSAEIGVRKTKYLEASRSILNRLAQEYGMPADTYAIKPLSNVGPATFSNLGLGSVSDAKATEVVDAFMNAKYIKSFDIAGSMKYALVSTSTFTSTPISLEYDADSSTVVTSTTLTSLETMSGTAIPLPNSHAFSESEAFYKAVRSDGKVVYIIYKTSFVNNFATNYTKLLDTHRDGIRHNVVKLDSSAGSGSVQYSLETKGWKMYEDNKFTVGADYVTSFTGYYEKLVALELASVMAYGVTEDKQLNVPSGSAGDAYTSGNGTIEEFYNAAKTNTSLYDSYMNFCLKYIDHRGYVSFEADAIAEYLTTTIVGAGKNSMLALDETRYTQNAFINLDGIEKTFNSNEVMPSTSKARKLIADYNNTKTRAFTKNSVFQTINYAAYTTSASDPSSDSLKYTTSNGSNKDERSALFKNYYNTFYSACYGLVEYSTDDILLTTIDSNIDYLANVTIVEDAEEEEDEGEGEEGEEEEENYILDTAYSGKLQSIIIFPKESIDIRYIEFGVEGVMAEGQALEITADLRYCYNGKVYYVENAFSADGGGASEITAEEHIMNLEYQSGLEIGAGAEFKDTTTNTLVNEKLLSFRNCIGDTPELRNKKLEWFKWVPNDKGKGEATSTDYGYNEYASTMGANYIYNIKSYDFIEICLNVKTKYSNFDTNYKINAKITSIYGTKV